MLQYIIRRILLAIPTFFGATIVVFFIVQFAPGGPFEQQLNAIRKGQGAEGGGSALGAENMSIPPSLLEATQRHYVVNEPIWKRYFIWLGVMPRSVNDYLAVIGSPQNVGNNFRVIVKKDASGQFAVYQASDGALASGWYVDPSKKENSVWVYQHGISGIFTLDFGRSERYQKPVFELISERLPISMQFGLISFVITYVVCFYLGTQKALRHGSKFDVISSSMVFIAFSVPGWALGAVLLVLLGGGSALAWFPTGGFQSNDYESITMMEKIADRLLYFVLPTIAYTLGGFASITLLMKNSLLDTLSQDFVRTAYAKGLRENRVIWMHAMRNSIIPLVASIGGIIGIFLGGSYLVEYAFNIDGIGRLSFEAIQSRDYNVVFAFAVISIIITLVGSIISDFMLALVDPRIRFS